jgi:hypothetical protein
MFERVYTSTQSFHSLVCNTKAYRLLSVSMITAYLVLLIVSSFDVARKLTTEISFCGVFRYLRVVMYY